MANFCRGPTLQGEIWFNHFRSANGVPGYPEAGYEVPVIASEAKQSIGRRKGRMDCFASLAMTADILRDLAARCARGLQFSHAQKTEGAGKTGCAPHPRSRVQCASKNAHTSILVWRNHTGLPCAMALRLIRVRPGDRLSCHRHPWEAFASFET